MKHHDQYVELLIGGHFKQNCVDCHNPHARANVGIKASCASCHKEIAERFYEKTVHGRAGFECIDCHTPYVGLSASAVNNYVGDVRTHLFAIDTTENYEMFSEDGQYVRRKLSLKYACLKCHQSRQKKWASQYATGHHEKK